MAVSAEQDNRVKIPNGTAAVNAELVLGRKPVTGSNSGKARIGAGGCNPSYRHKSEDLRKWILRPSRDYEGCVCRRKPAAAPNMGAAVFCFKEEKI